MPTVQDSRGLVETCQLETMKGRCHWRSELIVMTSARWGRMKTGRCLEIHSNALAALGHDPMFLGCSEDVLHVLDQKCSGRTSCDVRIPDPTLDEIKPCYSDLTRYLETSYICVKGNRLSSLCTVILLNTFCILMMFTLLIRFTWSVMDGIADESRPKQNLYCV